MIHPPKNIYIYHVELDGESWISPKLPDVGAKHLKLAATGNVEFYM